MLESFERTGKLEGQWTVDKDKWDALIFEAKKDMRVFGIGIHGPKDDKPRDFTIGYKYIIQDSPEGKEISKSENVVTVEVVCPPASEWTEKKYFKYLLKEKSGIIIKAG